MVRRHGLNFNVSSLIFQTQNVSQSFRSTGVSCWHGRRWYTIRNTVWWHVWVDGLPITHCINDTLAPLELDCTVKAIFCTDNKSLDLALTRLVCIGYFLKKEMDGFMYFTICVILKYSALIRHYANNWSWASNLRQLQRERKKCKRGYWMKKTSFPQSTFSCQLSSMPGLNCSGFASAAYKYFIRTSCWSTSKPLMAVGISFALNWLSTSTTVFIFFAYEMIRTHGLNKRIY